MIFKIKKKNIGLIREKTHLGPLITLFQSTETHFHRVTEELAKHRAAMQDYRNKTGAPP